MDHGDDNVINLENIDLDFNTDGIILSQFVISIDYFSKYVRILLGKLLLLMFIYY